MTSVQFDESLIGPLSGNIGSEPQWWGRTPTFSIADPDTAEYVEHQVARDRDSAIHVLNDELRSLFREVREQSEPRCVLHGLLVWGPTSVPRLAGYLSLTFSEAASVVSALECLRLVKATGSRDEMNDLEFVVDPNAVANSHSRWDGS